jgi:hypothetical protein
LILEFERLSYHTQDPKYLRQAAKAMQAIMSELHSKKIVYFFVERL